MTGHTYGACVATAVVLLLAACSSGGGESASSGGAAPTAATVAATPATTVTTTPPTTMVVPQVTVSPSRATIGTKISIAGEGFTADNWKQAGASLWVAQAQPRCDFFAAADHTVTVSADGRLTGEFVIPSIVSCRFTAGAVVDVTPGTYRIVYQCGPCNIGEVEVTAG